MSHVVTRVTRTFTRGGLASPAGIFSTSIERMIELCDEEWVFEKEKGFLFFLSCLGLFKRKTD
jgi:hypothetical protein